MAAELSSAFRRALVAWYRRHQRDLPWRRTRDPWAIWVSEVMLQQTQVKTALLYYPRFLERFPTPAALARASEPQVLAAWSGLGYYRRARHLHAAAREVVREHGGRVPGDPERFGRLPGIGRYTRGAVLSMGFGLPFAVLDGNVARVLSRVFALKAAVRSPSGARLLWALADALVPRRSPGDWNQAVMELGATICTPRAPRCAACPVSRHCRARELGRIDEFPPVVARRASIRVRRAVALISRGEGGRRGTPLRIGERDACVLMVRREGALLEGLWEPPGVDLAPGKDARHALRAELERIGVRATLEPAHQIVKHAITYRSIAAEVWRGRVAHRPRAPRRDGAARWIALPSADVPLTALARKLTQLPAPDFVVSPSSPRSPAPRSRPSPPPSRTRRRNRRADSGT